MRAADALPSRFLVPPPLLPRSPFSLARAKTPPVPFLFLPPRPPVPFLFLPPRADSERPVILFLPPHDATGT
jgi:hypothetical protein